MLQVFQVTNQYFLPVIATESSKMNKCHENPIMALNTESTLKNQSLNHIHSAEQKYHFKKSHLYYCSEMCKITL